MVATLEVLVECSGFATVVRPAEEGSQYSRKSSSPPVDYLGASGSFEKTASSAYYVPNLDDSHHTRNDDDESNTVLRRANRYIADHLDIQLEKAILEIQDIKQAEFATGLPSSSPSHGPSPSEKSSRSSISEVILEASGGDVVASSCQDTLLGRSNGARGADTQRPAANARKSPVDHRLIEAVSWVRLRQADAIKGAEQAVTQPHETRAGAKATVPQGKTDRRSRTTTIWTAVRRESAPRV